MTDSLPNQGKPEIQAVFKIDASGFQRDCERFAKALNEAMKASARIDAAKRERVARLLVEASLPRGFRWAVDHPKLVRFYYRLRPSKRPTIYRRWIP